LARCDDVVFPVNRVSFDDFKASRGARFDANPTRLKLPTADIDALVSAGRDTIVGNGVLRRFREALRRR